MRVDRPPGFTAVIIDFLSVTRCWRCRLFYGVAPGMKDHFNDGNHLKSLRETKRKRMRKDG